MPLQNETWGDQLNYFCTARTSSIVEYEMALRKSYFRFELFASKLFNMGNIIIDKQAEATRLAGVHAAAIDVWDDEKEALQFLTTPHPVLDHKIPFDIARTESGAKYVERILLAIKNGLPA